jgi:hypothetical protein
MNFRFIKNPQFKKLTIYWIFLLLLSGWLLYSNITGKRLFNSDEDKSWSADGRSYHK